MVTVPDLDQQAAEFCQASIRDWTDLPIRLLAETPELASYSFATAVILGDVNRVRREIELQPTLVVQRDDRWGWTPLHAACGSRWHRLDPARADGLLAVAQLLLAAGADPKAGVAGQLGQPTQPGGWTPLRCAVAGAANPRIVRLLLDRGAVPDDHDLYLAGFADDDHECLRLLLDHAPDVSALARAALSAPISQNDLDGVRLLLAAGADPRRYLTDDDLPCPVAYEAVRADCATGLLELLLAAGAEPDAVGPDGRSAHALAVGLGREDLAELLCRYGAADDASDADRFLSACLRADQPDAQRRLGGDPGLVGRLTADQQAGAMARAAEAGHTRSVGLMLDLGFPPAGRRDEDGATALHAAAYGGNASAVRLLIDRGADIEARDTRWESTPLVWAGVGSDDQPAANPSADWAATIAILIEAGAATDGSTLPADAPQSSIPPGPGREG
jgi:ankyrin repeat protein